MQIGKLLTVAGLLALSTSLAQAQDLKIGLQDDPDILDPDQSRTFVGRIVYASMCDKLVDITPDLEIVPALATGWEWNAEGTELTMTLRDDVVFHDGTPFNAEAVAANLDRSKNLETSRRKSEVRSIDSWEVMDEFTIKMTLSAPDATLIAQFADRSGMMLSPTAFEAAGEDFGANPVCAGPFKFVERVQQDRIVLERFAEYYRADEINFDSVTFLPIADTTVRLANLRAGDLDMLERLAATDVTSVEADSGLQLERATSLGYQGITPNIGNGEAAQNPLGQSNLVRKALSLSIDAKEFATLLADQSAGNFTASQIGWSGRVDPDGNIHQFMTSGGGLNDSKYVNPDIDTALNEARLSTDPAVRKESYNAAVAIQQEDMPIIYLYHPVWIWALDDSLSGFQPYPDGMIRLHGVAKN
jgi:peptide/nickel transport system substrate-binding protein